MRLFRRMTRDVAPAATAAEPPPRSPESQWFWDHYEWAPNELAQFIEGMGLDLRGKDVADMGCGDGILLLGVERRLQPGQLIGFDVNPVDVERLASACRREGVPHDLPASVTFRESAPRTVPAPDASFDFVYTWSAFEHIEDPLAVLREIRRILRPDGTLFLQLWPFYFSERGSHLWEWFPGPFHHLSEHHEDVVARLADSDLKPRDWTDMMTREFLHLNRVTLDELQRSLLGAGFAVTKLELISHAVTIPPELARYSLADLGIAGVKLLASPA